MTHRKHVKKNMPVPCTDANQRVREHYDFLDKKKTYALKLREKYMEEYKKHMAAKGITASEFDGAGMV